MKDPWRIAMICVTLGLAIALWQAVIYRPPVAGNLMTDAQIAEDASGEMTLPQMQRARFQPTTLPVTLGYTPSAFWFRLSIAPPEDGSPALLSVGLPHLDDVRLYRQDAAGHWQESRSGDLIPYNQRSWKSPRLAFVMAHMEHAETVYLRISTSGSVGINVAAQPLGPALADDLRYTLFHALFLGLIVTSIVLSVTFLFYSHDLIFLNFMVSQSFILAGLVTLHGYASVFLPDQSTSSATTLVGIASGVTGIIFHLHLMKRFQPLRVLFVIGCAFACFEFIAVPLALFSDARIALGLHASVMAAFLPFLGLMAWTARVPASMSLWSLRAIYSALVVSTSVWILPQLGIVQPNWMTLNGGVLHGVINFGLILSLLAYLTMRDRRAAEQSMLAMAQLQTERAIQNQSFAAQQNLTWMLAHEVGTSLSVIRMTVAKESMTPRSKSRIDRAITGLDSVIRHCLDADRIQSGHWQISPTRIDLRQILDQVIRQQDLPRLVLDRSSVTQAPIDGDPDLVRLILTHVIENAVKYSPAESLITVAIVKSTGPEGFDISVINRHLPGAAPDAHRVFTKFYRDDRVLATSGSGLGLFIVREIVEALRGTVAFHVADGNVTVRIWLQNSTRSSS